MQGNNTDYKPEQFIQCLYASALDGLDIPFWEFPEHIKETQLNPNLQQQSTAPTQSNRAQNALCRQAFNAAAVPNQASMSVQQISNIMDSDDSGDSDAADHRHTGQRRTTPAAAQPADAHRPDLFTVLPHAHSDPLAGLQPMFGGALHQDLGSILDAASHPIQQPLLPPQAPEQQQSRMPAPTSAARLNPAPSMLAESASRGQKPVIRSDPASVPFETKAGSVFALYCLHETQPGKVPIYLPLELLLQLLPVLRYACMLVMMRHGHVLVSVQVPGLTLQCAVYPTRHCLQYEMHSSPHL